MWLLSILQLVITAETPAYAGQCISSATTKESNKAATVELLKVVEKKKQPLITLLSSIRAQMSIPQMSTAVQPFSGLQKMAWHG